MGMNALEEASLGFLITDVSRLLRRSFQKHMVGSELTLAQSRALVYAARNPGIRQVDLADMLEVQPITLARLVDQLAELELIKREPDPLDRRAYKLFTQEKAEPYLNQIDSVIKQIREDALADVAEAEREKVIETLSAMRGNLARLL